LSAAKKWLRGKILDDALLGAIDYWRFPDTRASWGGPFNGQVARGRLFAALIDAFSPRAIIETGTFRGTTTEFMAATGLPIFTIENDRRLYGYSRMRFLTRRKVSVYYGDSRKVMKDLFARRLRDIRQDVLFVYLDAHAHGDLPLAEELDIVFCCSPGAIVMIDDFQVPFDPGYAHDKYRSGVALVLEYIAPIVEQHGLTVLYPSTLSCDETGAKRGCAVLAIHARHGAVLSGMEMLRAK